ncbi:MAG: hypothetical protein LBI14_00945 [Treponema sp.]|jgi:hypothetical protein|nr:hypothetical protein [Treponema sp.]
MKRNGLLAKTAVIITAIIMAFSFVTCSVTPTPTPTSSVQLDESHVQAPAPLQPPQPVPVPPPVYPGPGSSLTEKLSWLQTYAQTNTDYTIEINADESINPTTFSFSGLTNINITLIGIGEVRTISLSSNGSLFTIVSEVTLTLGNNITLQGRSDNNASLVQVNSGGTLVMDDGSKIISNTTTGSGGAVLVNNATFTMNGGEIFGNTAYGGGGVEVYGTFTMNGGRIFSNTAYAGGGALVSGTFVMNGGDISGNIAYGSGGGGVYVSGVFTMNDGKIFSNTAVYGGGGVGVLGTFTMNGGEISENSTDGGGGGVGVIGTFRIVNGTIYGSNEPNTSLRNTATNSGAALYVLSDATAQRGTFSGSTWNRSGDLSTTNNTIRVVNGNVQ